MFGGNPYKFMRREYQRQQERGGFFGGFFGGSDHSRRHRAAPQVQRQVDYSRAPPPRKQEAQPDPTRPVTSIVVMGGGMADWLAYGLEDAFSDSPNVEIVRKDKPHSGLLRYKYKSDLDWWHVARDDLAQQKANFVVMMLGVMDRQNIRESDVAKETAQEAQKNAADASKDGQAKDAKDAKDTKSAKAAPKPSRGVLTFRSHNGSGSTPAASTGRSPRSRARACRCSGSGCRRSAAPSRPPTRSISTISIASAPSAPASSTSTCGTASSTTPASIRPTVPTTRARPGACARPTACSSPNTARASSRITSSAKSAVT